ncbi:anaerobic ribonucleoside triphosphate reductase [Erysipelothrix sp. HDW6A]|uniref:anaerobic ribonucleoside triphosphate reductase n=1 Tax=Erysipelothrix sp. HDW6A TaxID=2714928 RepID=UPI00140E2F92|nr:anaerobic ribonucleoside triphosphate reductase [Erysipelothrix sp. HDW6A]QIK56756.1 anaerobic ribonucleoside triphosphate reductase [Erysipelothrix sp. HDW6A]
MENITILKRDNQKAKFNGEKIAVAIKKGFDSLETEKYNADDVNHVYNAVLGQIEEIAKNEKFISIEYIQDLIERELLRQNFTDVYEAFSSYRNRRNESRKIFISKQHKFLKAIEKLNHKESIENDEKRENANVDGNSPMGMMLQFGSTISKEFAKAYQMDQDFYEAHDSGQIHIHDMDFLPMGTTTCNQINLEQLFSHGFSTGHGHLRPPKDIMSYTALAAIAIQSNQNDQHGGQSIPAFDYYMAPGVLYTFKKQLKQRVYDFLEISDMLDDVDMKGILKHIDGLTSITIDVNDFGKFTKDCDMALSIINKAYDKAVRVTDRITFQAMEAFIHNLNTMHSRAGAQVPFSSINFGTDVSPEGRMVIENYLKALDKGLGKGETPIFPISIFKVKEGVNYFPEDINYDLFKLSIKVSAKRLFPNFSFIDSDFNKQYYKEGRYETEVAYMGCRTRVMSDINDPDDEVVVGRGNLSFTSINLVRLGIKHGILNNEKPDMEGFYHELDHLLALTKTQLLERYRIQCNMSVSNFKFLLGQGVWKNSKSLRPKDNLHKVLKHGTLAFGFIGLAECLKALTGKHHGESEASQELGLEIVKHMREKADSYAQETSLNFSLIATPAEGLSGRFVAIDRSIFGNIEGITDRDYYTNSFHVPVYFDISIKDKLALEAPYHALTNGGHITYVELDGDTTQNLEAFEEVVRMMHDYQIGYGAVNHPVDRDPVCGYTGIINDECPSCGRHETEGDFGFERIRRITGYLVGTLDRFNNAKRAEEHDRVKHDLL